MDSSRTRRDRSGHKGTIALVLAGLAVVIATTGTAVAVTASTVKISDSKYPKRIARVDSTGHLLTRNSTSSIPVSTISSSGLLTNYQSGSNFVTSPTTATLAITKVALSESRINASVSGNTLRVYVYKAGVDAAGTCGVAPFIQLGIYQFGAGDQIVDQFAHPLIVRPTGKAKYCLDLYTIQVGGSNVFNYLPAYVVTAYVVSGKYKGIGTFASPAKAPARIGAKGDGK